MTEPFPSEGPGAIASGERLTDREALELLERGDLLELGLRADELRRRLHPGGDVTFIVDRNINYTDYCLSGCRFCAFYKKPGSGEGYLLASEDIHRKIEETLELGGTAIMMQGGLNPDLDIRWFEEVFRGIKERFPLVHLHCLSPPEVAHIAKQSGLSVEETLRRLQAAGLGSLPGGGAEVLVDRVRSAISPRKIPTETWLEVMRVAHDLGMRTTATMMFGSLDAPAERVEHLRRIRDLQDETRGFTAFVPWSYKRGNTPMESKVKHVAGASRYLRVLAASRLYLDNFDHIQASWFGEGKKTGQIALHFGADDFGGTLFEEYVHLAAGHLNKVTQPEIETLIREAGFTPAQRTTLYEILRVGEGPAALARLGDEVPLFVESLRELPAEYPPALEGEE